MKVSGRVLALLFLFCHYLIPSGIAETFVFYQEPNFLTYDELRVLSSNPKPGGSLGEKLERFWKTPLIDNSAYYHQTARSATLRDLRLGDVIRVASWNIEKSLRMHDAVIAFTSQEKLRRLSDPIKILNDPALYSKMVDQQRKLMTADIILLQEMDIGVKRSGYINAPEMLARALNMNYAFGAEQLEVDPVMLGLEDLHFEDGAYDQGATEFYRTDPAKEKGTFGVAVLSRFPIKSVQVFQLKTKPYDWYENEKKKTSFLEKGRRLSSKTLFLNEITREMKVGSRCFFRVDLHVPGLPEDTLTVINVHLEIKCEPKGREREMKEILSYIKDIRHPVILAGDFNSAPNDISPVNVPIVVKKTLKDPTTWFSLAVSYLSPYALMINTTRGVSNYTKNMDNPLAFDAPVVAPNPTKKLFKAIRDFRFSDGGAFDFRGDAARSMNWKTGMLSNSNERDLKGFKTTFSVKRPIFIIGKFKLDWFFVKSYLTNPFDKSGPYRFAPHFGETLEELNSNLAVPISDHHPIVVDLPLKEPNIAGKT